MSWLKLSGALLIALILPTATVAAPSVAHSWHHHHPRLVGPRIGVGPTWDLYGDGFVAPGPPYTYDGPIGALHGPDSGGVNSVSNDFGTSGVLGHTNGMPVTGH